MNKLSTTAALPEFVDSDQDALVSASRMRRAKPRNYGSILGATVSIFVLLTVIYAFATSQLSWPTVGEYLFAPRIMNGVKNVILMTIVAMACGIAIGTVVAMMRLSQNRVLSTISKFYTWFFRGVPELLLLMLTYNFALVLPMIGIPGVFEARTIDFMTPIVATLIALCLHEGAYFGEIVRAGLNSVDSLQSEAARSLGMTRVQTLRWILFPQAMRMIVPPLGSRTIIMVKLTSLASVIQFEELLFNAEIIYLVNTRVVELLIVATFWYLVLVTVLTWGQSVLEKRFARGFSRHQLGGKR
ncbi:amino acid ABC transporter permease [Microbacterium sp. zg.B48]|uniref:amino acid ABC transporter permease n=1 Tax=Microbacterium sp. zg.B48 TaxID=2969408 RepID=UPI00214ABD42|nr:amino acid ABC transporter permease [Microbacterium sp. zg.B48]MCR2762481.1 amino acid ABC transporter permease [Microbacterium sp. zg.B48]